MIKIRARTSHIRDGDYNTPNAYVCSEKAEDIFSINRKVAIVTVFISMQPFKGAKAFYPEVDIDKQLYGDQRFALGTRYGQRIPISFNLINAAISKGMRFSKGKRYYARVVAVR